MINYHREKLYREICDKVHTSTSSTNVMTGQLRDSWLFDFRKIIMNGQSSDLICEIFEEQFAKHHPFQICALEVAGVPIATALMKHLYYKGYKNINAFFIRKSRKKSGLHKMIEGEILPDVPVILVDDLINSGKSFKRQVEVLADLGHQVHTIWSILRFRDLDYYDYFSNKKIEIVSVFELNDFTEALGPGVKNIKDSIKPISQSSVFVPEWNFRSAKPNLGLVVSKSQPALDENYIFTGSDNGNMWCLDQTSGSVIWNFTVLANNSKKNILSSPKLFEDMVIFGAYDGNVYALDKHTGKKRWVFWDADYVGSSPDINQKNGYVYIGLEFGVIKKRGGIACIDGRSGSLIWADYSHPAFTHSSPHFIEQSNEVVIGSNDGIVRMYDALNGRKKWEFSTVGSKGYSSLVNGGFSNGDIKSSCAYDAKHDYIAFGSIDGFLYVIERSNGNLVFRYKAEFGIYSTPCIHNDLVIFTSTDKHVRAINLNSHELIWDVVPDGTRIFSSPVIINEHVYVGTNAARLHQIDPQTGVLVSYFQAIERITNNVMYNPKTNRYFLPTFGNEIIKIKKLESSSNS